MEIKLSKNLILHYKDGFLSKVKKPLDKIEVSIDSNGDKYWYKNGRLHRDNDLPAIEYADGEKRWYKNEQLHRDNNLPAIEYADGEKRWYKRGQFVRSEG